MKKTMPKLGDVEAALKKDPAIDPPVGDYEAALESMRSDPDICTCIFDESNYRNGCPIHDPEMINDNE